MTARKTAVKTAPEAPAPEPQSDFQARLEAAAMRAGPIVEVPIDATFLPLDDSKYVSRRGAGWSAANQRAFLEAIAEGHGVDAACRRVGLSVASAYAFRRTAKGAPFALAWRAATLLARDCVAETLYVRALEGQVETIMRPDRSTLTRHRFDNRLGLTLLARLDRQVESAPDADVRAARLVAQEFDAFLDLIGRDAGAAHAGLFLARRAAPVADGEDPRDLGPIYALAAADRMVRTGVATAAEVDVADLDPTQRTAWTAEQWARADAAGIVAVATPAPPAHPDPEPADPEPADAEPIDPETARAPQQIQCSREPEPDAPVWWDEEAQEWRTHFPPPDDFDGCDYGEYGHVDYERSLSLQEEALMGPDPDHFDDAELAAQAHDRDAWFAALATVSAEPGAPAPELPPAADVRCPTHSTIGTTDHGPALHDHEEPPTFRQKR